MNTNKTPDNSGIAVSQSCDANPGSEEKKLVLDDPGALDRLLSSIPKPVRNNWFWILAYSLNLVYFIFALISANQGNDASFAIPMFPGIILMCILFVQIYADPIGPVPAGELDQQKRIQLEEKRDQQRHKWMIFAYSFMLLSLLLTFYPFIKPFHDKPIETLRDRPIAVFIGCSLDSPNKNLSCFKPKTENKEQQLQNEPVAGTWVINLGGYINQCTEDKDGKATTCQVSGGLLIPLYFIILALMGGSISLTRRLPELQKQVSAEHIATEQQPRLTQYEFREHLVFQIVQFISAPFLAILAYYLIDPSNTTNSVALAFTAGFASETILLMIRSIANKITPATGAIQKYGAVAGVISFKERTPEKVEVFLSESPQIHSITDEQGFYVLGNVPVGEHSISIKSIGTEAVLKKDTIKIDRAQAIIKKNIEITKHE